MLIACKDKLQEFDTTSVTLKGGATKGPISAATIDVYALDSWGNKTGISLGSTTTDNSGGWVLPISATPDVLLIEASGGSFIDESDPEPDFTKKRIITLESDEVLQSLLAPGSSTASITSLTHALTATYRKIMENNIGKNNIGFYYLKENVENALGFDPFTTMSADPLVPSLSASLESRQYGMLLGGFATAMNNVAITLDFPSMNYPIINAISSRFGECAATNMNVSGSVVLSLNGISLTLPYSVSLENEIKRFRNNNYSAYNTDLVQTKLINVDKAALCFDGPRSEADFASTIKDISVNIPVLNNDFDFNGLSGLSVLLPSDNLSVHNASLSLQSDGSILYTPPLNYVGPDSFLYIVSDGVNSSEAEVSIQVNSSSVNAAPVFSSLASASVDENITSGTEIYIATATDAESNVISYLLSGNDANRFSLDANTGVLTAVQTFNYESPIDTNSDNLYNVDITASDGKNNTILNLTISVNDVDEVPVFSSSTTHTSNENMINTGYLAKANDDVGSSLSFGISGGVDQSLFNINGTTGELSFKNTPNYETPLDSDKNNVYEIELKVSDQNSNFANLNLSLTLQDVNESPVAVDDSFSAHTAILKNYPLALNNDTDVENNTLSINLFDSTSTLGGNISLSGNVFSYTSPSSFVGTDTFTYSVSDTASNVSNSATITITVIGDTDGDGLFDDDETNIYGTNINVVDTDGDGYTDYVEVNGGTNPLDNSSFPSSIKSVSISDGNTTISSDVTWSIVESPYWIKDDVSIQVGATLTIDAGVVVKFSAGKKLVANGGDLKINGGTTVITKVYMTSMHDNSVIGSITGSTGSPAAGDWAGIEIVSSPASVISGLDLRYAITGLGITDSSPSVSDVNVTKSSYKGMYVISNTTGISSTFNNIVIDDVSSNSGLWVGGTGGVISLTISGVNKVTNVKSTLVPAIVLTNNTVFDLSGFTISGGKAGVEVLSTSNGILHNSIIRESIGAFGQWGGVMLDTAGFVKIKNNVITNHPTSGIYIQNAAVDSEIKHNIIRNNHSTMGGAIYLQHSKNVKILNNLILDNEVTINGSAIELYSSGSSATLSNNTIVNNLVKLTYSDENITKRGAIHTRYSNNVLSMYDNIIWGNTLNNLYHSVFQNQNFWLMSTNNVLALNLLTATASIGDLPSATAATHKTSDPSFSNGWYVSSGSAVIDGGSTSSLPAYYSSSLPELFGTPIIQANGSIDSGQVDIGYHYNSVPKTIDSGASVVTYTSTIAKNASMTITITPKTVSDVIMGPGLKVELINVSSGSAGKVIDKGDGTYTVVFTASNMMGSDTMTVKVNDITISNSVTVNWSM